MKSIQLFCSALLLFTACARTVVPRADIQYVDAKDGVITVSAQGYGVNPYELQENAERNALEALLFRGIPGSPQNLPLVSEDMQATRTQSGYLRDFFDTKKYRQFITHSSAEGSVAVNRAKGEGAMNGRLKPGKSQAWAVGINLPALRRDMEANHVIRKFGY